MPEEAEFDYLSVTLRHEEATREVFTELLETFANIAGDEDLIESLD